MHTRVETWFSVSFWVREIWKIYCVRCVWLRLNIICPFSFDATDISQEQRSEPHVGMWSQMKDQHYRGRERVNVCECATSALSWCFAPTFLTCFQIITATLAMAEKGSKGKWTPARSGCRLAHTSEITSGEFHTNFDSVHNICWEVGTARRNISNEKSSSTSTADGERKRSFCCFASDSFFPLPFISLSMRMNHEGCSVSILFFNLSSNEKWLSKSLAADAALNDPYRHFSIGVSFYSVYALRVLFKIPGKKIAEHFRFTSIPCVSYGKAWILMAFPRVVLRVGITHFGLRCYFSWIVAFIFPSLELLWLRFTEKRHESLGSYAKQTNLLKRTDSRNEFQNQFENFVLRVLVLRGWTLFANGICVDCWLSRTGDPSLIPFPFLKYFDWLRLVESSLRHHRFLGNFKLSKRYRISIGNPHSFVIFNVVLRNNSGMMRIDVMVNWT